MNSSDIYGNIAERTQGCIYAGVVGPVRTGKSTFIKRFMDLMVLPNVDNLYVRQRVLDELPQSGSGKTITTTEPKFVPAEAVTLTLPHNVSFKVRMVDCVGYLVPGAMGHEEEGKARMVRTPWSDEEMTFAEAAETGTRKVITDHSTIGIAVTTDGTIGDLKREAYIEAEDRTIQELKELGKPFVVIVNSTEPDSKFTADLVKAMKEKHRVPVMAVDCMKMSRETLDGILQSALYQFPVSQIGFNMPGFMDGVDIDHWIKAAVIENIKRWAESFEIVDDIETGLSQLADGEIVTGVSIASMDLGTGAAEVNLELEPGLFYRVVEELLGEEVPDDARFFALLKEFAASKRAYDKLEDAMKQVEEKGYGIVQPKLSEMVLQEPEIFRQGNKFGIRMTAKAPSLHIIRTDITTEVAPVVGSEAQSEDLIKYLLTEFETDPSKIWDTNIFGKSLQEMVTEQMKNKLSNVPENIRVKIQNSLQKISDEGRDFFICIVL